MHTAEHTPLEKLTGYRYPQVVPPLFAHMHDTAPATPPVARLPHLPLADMPPTAQSAPASLGAGRDAPLHPALIAVSPPTPLSPQEPGGGGGGGGASGIGQGELLIGHNVQLTIDALPPLCVHIFTRCVLPC
jgi:hypothetical protein